jgi:hypothetical protein
VYALGEHQESKPPIRKEKGETTGTGDKRECYAQYSQRCPQGKGKLSTELATSRYRVLSVEILKPDLSWNRIGTWKTTKPHEPRRGME